MSYHDFNGFGAENQCQLGQLSTWALMCMQEGYFGLFVDGTLDAGMSRPSATYANPCLASEEVWMS